MFNRAIKTFIPVIILFFAGATYTHLYAQQGQETLRLPTGLQLGESIEQNLFIDQLGLRLAMEKFYEGFLDIDTYTLGTGDLLGISLEGNVSGSLRGIRVNSQGTVILPEIGAVKVDGLLLEEAEEHISRLVGDKLTDTEASVFLEQPRTIKIDLVGNIPHSGPHLVFAQTRLDQAIFHAFFPPDAAGAAALSPQLMLANKYPVDFIESNEFALRSITVNRSDGSQTIGDLIRFLRTGDKEANPIVREGDIIHINRAYDYTPRVSISGAVNRPLELEYHPDDTIKRLISMAGGTTHDAADESIRITRITENGLQETILDDEGSISNFEVRPNDRIIIPFDRQKRATHNVQVYGEAIYTGRFSIEDGVTTLYELLHLTGGLTDRALPAAAYLIRSQPARTEYGIRNAFDPAMLTRTSDQYQQGFEYLNLEAQLIQNRVYVNLRDEDQLKSVKLFHGDRLHIPKNEGTIFVFGQVNSPGYYNFDQEMSSSDYITKAGGFALSADQDRVFVIKSEYNSWYRPDDIIIEPGDLVFVDREPFDELQAARNYDLQKRSQRNSNIQLIMTGLTTITSIITAYIAVTR